MRLYYLQNWILVEHWSWIIYFHLSIMTCCVAHRLNKQIKTSYLIQIFRCSACSSPVCVMIWTTVEQTMLLSQKLSHHWPFYIRPLQWSITTSISVLWFSIQKEITFSRWPNHPNATISHSVDPFYLPSIDTIKIPQLLRALE